MSYTLDFEPVVTAIFGLSSLGLQLWEEIVLTFHIGRARFVDDASVFYGVLYTLFWIGVYLALCSGVLYVIYVATLAVGNKAVCWVKYARARQYVEPASTPLTPREASNGGYSFAVDGTCKEPISLSDTSKLKSSLKSVYRLNSREFQEMAMPTSTFIATEEQNAVSDGVMSLRSDDYVIGMASCIGYSTHGPCLVTAAHVWAELWKSGNATIEHKGESYKINFNWKVVLHSSPHDLDIIVIAVPHPVFAALGVRKLKTNALSSSQKCVTYGFDELGFFGTSTGRVEHKPREAFRCKHYATTTYGFSGSPLVVAGNAVGIHTGGEMGALGNYNLGTLFFWTDLKQQLESSTTTEGSYTFQEELEQEPERVVKFNAKGKTHSLEQIGRSVKLRSMPKSSEVSEHPSFDSIVTEWAEEELGDWESKKIKQVIKPKAKKTSFKESNPTGESPDWEDFPKEDRSPRTKPNPMKNLPEGFTPDTFVQGLALMLNRIQEQNSSLMSAPTKSARRRARKRANLVQTALVSNISESARTKSTAVPPTTLPASTSPLKDGQISQSGAFPKGGPWQSSEVSSSKPVDSSVLIVHFTRRQEKLYNRVCQTRKYQQLWGSLGYEEKGSLRRKTLEFVLSSKINLRETQVQDFLAQFSLETTPIC